MARRLAAVAARLRHRVGASEQSERERGYAAVDGFEQTTAEVAAAMNLSPMAASYLVSHAEALDARLPRVAALPAEGRTDWRTARLIIGRTDLVTDDAVIAQLDRSLAERIGKWHSWSKQRIVNAEDDRYIGITAQDNGMAEVYGTVAAAPQRSSTAGSRNWLSRFAPPIRERWTNAAPMRSPR